MSGNGILDGSTAAAAAPLSELDDPSVVGQGLVRRQLDRSITEWAIESAGMTGLEQAGEVIAEEVLGIEFMYFDGLEFRTEWDTELEGKLPLAIQVMLMLAPSDTVAAVTSQPLAAADLAAEDNIQYYRLMVHLPTSSAQEETDSEMMFMGL
jgi:hypothetical protein